MKRRFILPLVIAVVVISALALVVQGINNDSSRTTSASIRSTPPLPHYVVVKDYDGDTIQVKREGTLYKVRFLGIDTPETHRPGFVVQCGGPEASAYTKNLLAPGSIVSLKPDSSQPSIDRYGRLLRFVYLGRLNVSYRLVRKGFAKSYHYRGTSTAQQPHLDAGQTIAQAEKLGIWGPPCNGDTSKPEPAVG